MHERLPVVGMVFAAGDIDYRSFQTLVQRTDLIVDLDTLAAVDGQLARRASRWAGLSQGRLSREADRIVARADEDAVRRRREREDDREVVVTDCGDGTATVYANVSATDGHAFDRHLDALAATVCDADPRTKQQRRSAAIGAIAAKADRLGCRCGKADCPAGGKVASNVVLHIVAEQSAVDGRSAAPAYLIGGNESIPAEMVAELADTARCRPLADLTDAPPEPGYVPSKALADFVRSRDLTCRAFGCDVPADKCDIDHCVPYAEGGLTHASNLSCKCRTHHLEKTFGGWRDIQLPDGTLIWILPDGQVYVTTPGNPSLSPNRPNGQLPAPRVSRQCADRTAMMPKRKRSRAQNRSDRVAAERRQNRDARIARRAKRNAYYADLLSPERSDGEPPPF
jgi:hypothetical protein